MDGYQITLLVLYVLLVLATGKFYATLNPSRDYSHVRMISRVGIFGAMAAILYMVPVFKLKLPFFPSFLELHFDEVPAFIAGFAYGPLAGFAVIVVKTIIKLPMSSTLLVGELTDLILSSIYVCVAAFIYQKKRNLKGVAIGFGIATALQVIVAMVLNVYVMIPFYSSVMGFKISDLLFLMQKAVPAITDVQWSYAFFAVLPFNLFKDAIVIIVTFILYRSLHVFLRFEGKGKGRTRRPS